MHFTKSSFWAAAIIVLTSSIYSWADDLKIMTYNVYFLPEVASTNQSPGNQERAIQLSEASFMKEYDVIILNELFDTNPADTLFNGLVIDYPYRTPIVGESNEALPTCSTTTVGNVCWNKVEGHYSIAASANGGVAILSKFPILERVEYVFQAGCGLDAFANKGFAYIRISTHGSTYHIIGTHTQANDSTCRGSFRNASALIRAAQFREIESWIQSKGIPPTEPIIIAGDMNVNKGTDEYDTMLRILNVSPPHYSNGVSATWDPATNDLAAWQYAGQPGEYLDYVFLYNNKADVPFLYNRVITPSLPFPNTWQASARGWNRESDEYSDHYPVAAVFSESDLPSYVARTPRYRNVALVSRSQGWYVTTEKDGDTYYLRANATMAGTGNFSLNGWGLGYFDPYCATTGNYKPGQKRTLWVKIHGSTPPGNFKGAYWTWEAGSGAMFMADSAPAKTLALYKKESGCLNNGDIIYFMGGSGAPWAAQAWPSGPDKGYLYMKKRSRSVDRNAFTITNIE